MGVLRALQGLQGTIGQPTAQVVGGSLRFKGGQYLERTSTAGNQTTWTWSGWIKTSDLSGNNIFGEDGGYPNASASFNTSGELRFTAAAADSSVFLNVIPSALFRDLSAWYHFVFIYDSRQSTSSERARIYVNGSRITDLSTATYPSLNATTVVNSNGNAFRIGSHSGVDHLQGYQSNAYLIDGQALGPEYFGFTDPLTNTWRPRKAKTSGPNVGTTWSSVSTISSGGAASGKPLSNGFDGSISNAFEGDTSGATVTVPVSATIVKGGVKVYAAVTSGNPLVVLLKNGGTTVETINTGASGGQFYSSSTYSGPITSLVISRTGRAPEFNAIGINGIILKDNSTTNLDFGTNGFYLPMDNQDDFEKDRSGKGHIFTKSGFSGTSSDPDVVKDSPSGAVFGNPPTSGITTTSSAPANYCTFNTLDKYSGITLSNANLTLDHSSGSTLPFSRSTIGMSSGKFYFEVTRGSGTYGTMGIATVDSDLSMYAGRDSNAVGGYEIYTENTEKWAGGSGGSSSGYLTVPWDSDGDVASCYFDADNGTIGFKVNGTDMGIAFTGINTSKTYYFQCGSQGTILHANWGQKPFKYAPPEGYLPLNSATVRPETVIVRPDQYVGVTTWSGDGSSNRPINVGLQPDLVWVKRRSTSSNHVLMDTIRGHSKGLYPNLTSGEQNDSSINSFNSDGFTVNGNGDTNQSSQTFVGWSWKAGGNKNTFNKDDVGYASAAAAGLDGGTYTPTGASIGTKQGFSIIKYTGSASTGTFSHGLSQAPDFMICKRDASGPDWVIYHRSMGSNKVLYFTDAAAATSTAAWNNTNPTSSLVHVGNSGDTNSSDSQIYYIWHSVPGLQKFGTYEGGGNAFVEL